jgi:hypothetical protein
MSEAVIVAVAPIKDASRAARGMEMFVRSREGPGIEPLYFLVRGFGGGVF